jgi:putative tryptophan/tyrosine transport system substrate-binding protein
MNRRTFLGTLAGSLLAGPFTAGAQLLRIGFVEAGALSVNRLLLDVFRQGLRELGYVEDRNILIVDRWADGNVKRFPALLGELIRLKVDLVVVASTPGALAAKEATSTVPVVFFGVSDPVGIGVATSLGHPAGNLTGVALGTEDGLAGKWVELLLEVVPKARQIAVLRNPDAKGIEPRLRELQTAAATLRLTLHTFEVRNVSDFEDAFAAMSSAHVDGLVAVADPLTLRYRETLVQLAARRRLPATYGFPDFARSGGLIGYGPSVSDQARRAATYVDKILKGAKPADLPIEQPTKFELVINLKTAKALGLTIPQSLLQRADQVIE